MSVAVGALPRAGALPFDGDYEPVSSDRTIQRLWQDQSKLQSWSATDWAPQTNAALLLIHRECGRPDWDEPGAAPVLVRTIRYAALLIDSLANIVPSGTPAPDVVPERDGEISLSWYGSDGRLFSVSVGPHGKLNYAGQFGEEGADHGWQPVRYDSRWALAASLDAIARNIGRLAVAAPVRSTP